MKIFKNKKVRIFIVILCMFLIYNVVWFFMVQHKYDAYAKEMEEFRPNLSYYLHTDDYLYNVKYPDYLTYTGNLCVSTSDERYALLIWPSFFGKTEYGVQIITKEKENYSIMIDKNMNALKEKENEIVEKYKEVGKKQYVLGCCK